MRVRPAINMTGSLPHWEKAFGDVGWFIPPYIQMGIISEVAAQISQYGTTPPHGALQVALSKLYEPIGLSAMVIERYPIVPFIQDYKETIAEAIEAHFLCLDHVAVAGLVPVIEGAGRLIAQDRGILEPGIKDVFDRLGSDIKNTATRLSIGAVGEIVSMIDSFTNFARHAFFAQSSKYIFGDGNNRHGITHGHYADRDFGTPLNFFKTIAAVDFLTFVASFQANISWFAPNPTEKSIRLANRYAHLKVVGLARSRFYA